MNNLHYKAIRKGAAVWNRYVRLCRLHNGAWTVDLSEADLSWANLSEADLSDTKNADLPIAQTTIVPDVGAFDAWKKCKNNIICHLRIPSEAKRSNASGRKCRAEYVEVVEVFGADVGLSTHDGKTEYRKGETVRCDKWDDNRWQECSGGIHFFITRIEAENYN